MPFVGSANTLDYMDLYQTILDAEEEAALSPDLPKRRRSSSAAPHSRTNDAEVRISALLDSPADKDEAATQLRGSSSGPSPAWNKTGGLSPPPDGKTEEASPGSQASGLPSLILQGVSAYSLVHRQQVSVCDLTLDSTKKAR